MSSHKNNQDAPSVGESHVTGLGTGNDTSLGHERVGKGGFTVVNVRNDGHVTDVGWSVHETTDLVDGEARVSGIHVYLSARGIFER